MLVTSFRPYSFIDVFLENDERKLFSKEKDLLRIRDGNDLNILIKYIEDKYSIPLWDWANIAHKQWKHEKKRSDFIWAKQVLLSNEPIFKVGNDFETTMRMEKDIKKYVFILTRKNNFESIVAGVTRDLKPRGEKLSPDKEKKIRCNLLEWLGKKIEEEEEKLRFIREQLTKFSKNKYQNG